MVVWFWWGGEQRHLSCSHYQHGTMDRASSLGVVQSGPDWWQLRLVTRSNFLRGSGHPGCLQCNFQTASHMPGQNNSRYGVSTIILGQLCLVTLRKFLRGSGYPRSAKGVARCYHGGTWHGGCHHIRGHRDTCSGLSPKGYHMSWISQVCQRGCQMLS
eukprot:jgi/Mesvir1/22506/Mv25751-RA.1